MKEGLKGSSFLFQHQTRIKSQSINQLRWCMRLQSLFTWHFLVYQYIDTVCTGPYTHAFSHMSSFSLHHANTSAIQVFWHLPLLLPGQQVRGAMATTMLTQTQLASIWWEYLRVVCIISVCVSVHVLWLTVLCSRAKVRFEVWQPKVRNFVASQLLW